MKIEINLNDVVRVRLTDYGRALHRKNYDRLMAELVALPRQSPYVPPKEDADGWSEWTLWVLCEEFGRHFVMGMNTPFEGGNIHLKKD